MLVVGERADARALAQELQLGLEQQGHAMEHVVEGLLAQERARCESMADNAAAAAGKAARVAAATATQKVFVCEGERIMSFLPPSLMVRSVCRNFRDMAKPGVCSTQVADLGGRTELVLWALDNGMELYHALLHLGEHGNLHGLRLLQARTPALPWSQLLRLANDWGNVGPMLWSRAVAAGQLEVLQWAHANGCPWSEETCEAAAAGGHLDILQWARANGCRWDTGMCSEAARVGHLEVLQWARANGCPWDTWTCPSAAQGGHLEVLKWARANSCPWDEMTFGSAASGGHLEVLQWARANGCPWDEQTCANAAHGGHLEVLQWARANGCPWCYWTCFSAAHQGHLEVLRWARANGCPWVAEVIQIIPTLHSGLIVKCSGQLSASTAPALAAPHKYAQGEIA